MLRDAQRAGLPLVLRPRAAPARWRPPAVPVARAAGATSRSCAPTSRRTAACSTTTPAIRSRRSTSYEDGDHLSREGRCRYTRAVRTNAPAPAVSVIFHSLDFVVFFLVVVALYWRLDAPRAERPAARRQLLLLRLRPSLVPDPDRHVDDRSTTAPRAGWSGGRNTSARSCGVSIVVELRDAGVLQVLQLLRRQRRRGARPRWGCTRMCRCCA